MPQNWDEINEDEMLNYEEANTGKMAKYYRIMFRRLRESTHDLGGKVEGLIAALSNIHETIHDETGKMIAAQKKISQAQGRQQNIIVALTWVIAIATVSYVGITWWSVSTMRESNNIQKRFIQIEEARDFRESLYQ